MRMRGMIAALAVVCSSVAWAGNRCVWTGLGGDGKWSNAANWQDETVPASGKGDTVVLTGDANTTQDIGDDFSLDQLVFSNTTAFATLGGQSLSFTTAEGGIAIAAMSSKGFSVSNDLAFANSSYIRGGKPSSAEGDDKAYSCTGDANFYGALNFGTKTLYYTFSDSSYALRFYGPVTANAVEMQKTTHRKVYFYRNQHAVGKLCVSMVRPTTSPIRRRLPAP